MDLLCCENEQSRVPRAYQDPVLLDDDRVLQNLLMTEDKYVVYTSYFRCSQSDLKPEMRDRVGRWMLEVCEEEHCQVEVFSLAMNCLDRFLSVVRIKRHQLQLLGTVCLFLSSKIRQSRPLSAEKLCMYTDNSVTLKELLDWELLVLSRLKWDLAAITPHDFIDHILRRIPLLSQGILVVSRHSRTFIDLCATDFKFSIYPPSMIAASCIAAAIKGMPWINRQWRSQTELLGKLHDITGIEVDCLRECLEQIEVVLAAYIRAAQQATGAAAPSGLKETNKVVYSSNVEAEGSQPETPTDVQDVHF